MFQPSTSSQRNAESAFSYFFSVVLGLCRVGVLTKLLHLCVFVNLIWSWSRISVAQQASEGELYLEGVLPWADSVVMCCKQCRSSAVRLD